MNGTPQLKKYDRKEQKSILSTIVKSTLGFEGIHDCLFRQSEPWLIEDLTMSDVWYIAVQAYTDSAFRKVFQDYLHCYRSPFNILKSVTSDHILRSTFNIATIVDQVKSASLPERNDFLNTLIIKGSPPMVAPFLIASIDLDEGLIWKNYLGNALACGNLSVIDMLIDAGADCVRAFPQFLEAKTLEVSNSDAKTLDFSNFDALYSKLLDSMILPRGLVPVEFDWPDPVNAMLRNDRAMETHPDAPMRLLEHGQFEPKLVNGTPWMIPSQSYVYNAILYNRPAPLAWFLAFGAKPNDIIQNIFDTDQENLQCLKGHSCLTMAVELGRTACVEILIEHAENIFDAADSWEGAGRSAISLARSFPGTLHPRLSSLSSLRSIYGHGIVEISAAEDASILTLLEAALGVASGTSPTSDLGLADKACQQHTGDKSSFFANLSTAILHFVENSFHFMLTRAHTQLFHSIKDQFDQLWQMSPLEALLVRLTFFIAYCIIFCYKMVCFTTYLTKVHKRSEFRLVGKFCVVALICYYLQFLKPEEIA